MPAAQQEVKVGVRGCVGVTVVGVDAGLRRSVLSVIGDYAHEVFNDVVGGLRRGGVSVKAGGGDGYYVLDIAYPGIGGYRGAELTYNLFEKVGAVLLRSLTTVGKAHNNAVTALSLEYLGLEHDYMVNVVKTWRLLLLALLGSNKVVSELLGGLRDPVWCSEGWLSYLGYVTKPFNGKPPYLVLVSPEYGSQVCPICYRYLGEIKERVVEIKCPVCGFTGDADVIGSLNTAARGCCAIKKYLGGELWRSPMAPWAHQRCHPTSYLINASLNAALTTFINALPTSVAGPAYLMPPSACTAITANASETVP